MYRNGLLWELLNFPKSLGNPDGEMFIRHRAGPCLASWQTTCFETARKIKPKPFWRLGSRQASGCSDSVWQQQWLWVSLSCSGKHPRWQRRCCYNAQCSAVSSHRWGVLGGSFTGCWWGCRNGWSRTLETMAPLAGQSQILGMCSLGFALHFVCQTWEAVSSFPKLAAILLEENTL